MGAKGKRSNDDHDIARRNFKLGCQMVEQHPMFAPILEAVWIRRDEDTPYPPNGLVRGSQLGVLYCHPKRRAEPDVWARAIAHCALHLGMDHFVEKPNAPMWNIACDCIVERFLCALKFGKAPQEDALPPGIHDEQDLYRAFLESGAPPEMMGWGTAGDVPDMMFENEHEYRWRSPPKSWSTLLARGISGAVENAVDRASGVFLDARERGGNTHAARAKSWFIASYPLLGAVAAAFTLVEDPDACLRMGISIAAVSCSMREIYINPAAHLSTEELRFVMAHEFLHAALRHDARHEWRDAYLWNVACDYVINQWLTDMGVGERPDGVLYDAQFQGLNAESIYDRIVTDMRTYRKLATLRGVGLGDMLPPKDGRPAHGGDVDLDDFYRRALSQGLEYHREQGRGYLPAGLVEEIRALGHPPIPWDVELARWFDERFEPVEKQRSFARPSRRQSSTPDIPRPSWAIRREAMDGRTFGVVLDTSGSMDRALLAASLGAIASYAAARDVPAARVVFCDAQAYDQGYMMPEEIAGSVKVKGRGGTVLQPGIDALDRAEDFPKRAPVLIITDGGCENRLVLHGREHAFLVPAGANLPFVPKGEVFRVR